MYNLFNFDKVAKRKCSKMIPSVTVIAVFTTFVNIKL